jgi:hypothetical protein
VTDNRCLLIGKCRNVGFGRTSNSQSFYPGLKLVREESTPVIPSEMERLVSELLRDRHAFKKKISDQCMIARPGPAIALLIGF